MRIIGYTYSISSSRVPKSASVVESDSGPYFWDMDSDSSPFLGLGLGLGLEPSAGLRLGALTDL